MYSREKLERLLRQAKVTTQSIQKVSQWMLTHRQNLSEMVTLWSDLVREGKAEHQIVYLYVANDAMQVGVRKFGRHIAAAFEKKLVDIFQLVMRDGEEKVKRCAIKIVGIWKERAVVSLPLLAMLENVCAGKPPMYVVTLQVLAMYSYILTAKWDFLCREETFEADEKLEERKAKILLEMTSDAAAEHVLEDMTEVVESSVTTQLATRLQDLVNATISADMLSDRMFQLESSISVFHHACGEVDEEEEADVVVIGEEHMRNFPTMGGIAWSKMDQQVYDLDLDNSRGHVEQYRINLTNQATKRELLMKELQELEKKDLFSFSSITLEEANQQERALEKLYGIACEAEAVELKQLEEQRAEFRARQESMAASATDPLYFGFKPAEEWHPSTTATSSSHGRSDSGNSHLGYRSTSREFDRAQQPSLRRHSSASIVTGRDEINNRYSNHRNIGQNDRYDEADDRYGVYNLATTKRPKVHHSHSMDSQNGQWQHPRGGNLSNPYIVGEREQSSFSPRNDQYTTRRDHYQAPPPRHGRRTRWDSMPENRNSNIHYEDRRW